MKEKYINKECKYHGTTSFVMEYRGTYRCRICRSIAVSKRRKDIKIKLVKDFGGKCNRCGYFKCVAALDFHHKDPFKKEFSLGMRGLTRSYKKIFEEAKKCELICANCHREEHQKG